MLFFFTIELHTFFTACIHHNSFPSTVNHSKFNPKMIIKESFLEYISVNSRFVNDNREWY